MRDFGGSERPCELHDRIAPLLVVSRCCRRRLRGFACGSLRWLGIDMGHWPLRERVVRVCREATATRLPFHVVVFRISHASLLPPPRPPHIAAARVASSQPCRKVSAA